VNRRKDAYDRGAPAPQDKRRAPSERQQRHLHLVAPPQGHMQPTEGDRDEACANYGECLTAHVRAHRRADPHASCPRDCRWRERVETRATEFASSGRSTLARPTS
jgi:hypothetical protein